jgi:hypothetical protein
MLLAKLLVVASVPVLVENDDVVEEKDVSLVSLVLRLCWSRACLGCLLACCCRNRFLRCRRSDRSSLRTRLRRILFLDRSVSLASSCSLRTTTVIRASILDVIGAVVDASCVGGNDDSEVEPGVPRRLFLLSSTRREADCGTYDGHDGGGTSFGRTGFDTAVSCGWNPLTWGESNE